MNLISPMRLRHVPLPDMRRLLEAHDRASASGLQTFEAFLALVGETCHLRDPDIDLRVPLTCRYADPETAWGPCWGRAESNPRRILIRFNELAGLADWIALLAEEWRHIAQYDREDRESTLDSDESENKPPVDYIDQPEEQDAKAFADLICSELCARLI